MQHHFTRETKVALSPGVTPVDQLWPMLRTLQTGDIILFTANRFTARLIKWAQRCRWHHIGIALRYPDGRVSIFHAVSDGVDLQGVRGSGPMETDLQKLLESGRYTGFAIRRLQHPLCPREHHDFVDFLRFADSKAYESGFKGLWTLFKANNDVYDFSDSDDSSCSSDDEYTDATEVWFKNKEDLDEIFCSELVAAAYRHIGRIRVGQNASEYVPADFAQGRESRGVRGLLGPEERFDIIF